MILDKECQIYLGVFNKNEELIDKKFYRDDYCLTSSLTFTEITNFSKIVGDLDLKILIKFDKHIDNSFVIKIGDKFFNIVSLKNNGGLNEFLTLYLKKVS